MASPGLLSLYNLLGTVAPSPIVALNRAVALAMVEGPAAGLVALEAIEGARLLDGYFLLPATRDDLCRKLGRFEDAEAACRKALGSTCTEPERRFLLRRLAEMSGA